jgi:hypothetical protein
MVTDAGKQNTYRLTYRLYKHWDGYPSGNLPIIANALERAALLLKAEEKFPRLSRTDLTAECVAGLIVGESTTISGIGAKIEEVYDNGNVDECLGFQGDLEWLYIVDLSNRVVEVYGGFGDGETLMKMGVKDPRKNADQRDLPEINEAIELIERSGFQVNGKNKTIKIAVKA